MFPVSHYLKKRRYLDQPIILSRQMRLPRCSTAMKQLNAIYLYYTLMASKLSIHFPGAIYHIILRGNAGQPVFSE
jgi:hypothetical protein